MDTDEASYKNDRAGFGRHFADREKGIAPLYKRDSEQSIGKRDYCTGGYGASIHRAAEGDKGLSRHTVRTYVQWSKGN